LAPRQPGDKLGELDVRRLGGDDGVEAAAQRLLAQGRLAVLHGDEGDAGAVRGGAGGGHALPALPAHPRKVADPDVGDRPHARRAEIAPLDGGDERAMLDEASLQPRPARAVGPDEERRDAVEARPIDRPRFLFGEDGQRDREGGAAAGAVALHLDGAAVEPDELPHDGEADAEAGAALDSLAEELEPRRRDPRLEAGPPGEAGPPRVVGAGAHDAAHAAPRVAELVGVL